MASQSHWPETTAKDGSRGLRIFARKLFLDLLIIIFLVVNYLDHMDDIIGAEIIFYMAGPKS